MDSDGFWWFLLDSGGFWWILVELSISASGGHFFAAATFPRATFREPLFAVHFSRSLFFGPHFFAATFFASGGHLDVCMYVCPPYFNMTFGGIASVRLRCVFRVRLNEVGFPWLLGWLNEVGFPLG